MERWFERNMGRGLKTDSDGEATTEMVKIGASRVIIVVYYTTQDGVWEMWGLP